MGGKPKLPANNRPLGPFARDRSLTTIDRRTKAGRVLRQVRADLTEMLGGSDNVTAAQALIIQSAAVKATRLFLISEQILSGNNFSEGSDAHALAYLNSMRQDLTALGLERRVKDVTPTLASIIAAHGEAKEPPAYSHSHESKKRASDVPAPFHEAAE